jgi:hypothetical protein
MQLELVGESFFIMFLFWAGLSLTTATAERHAGAVVTTGIIFFFLSLDGCK